jgi:hypothetical protein
MSFVDIGSQVWGFISNAYGQLCPQLKQNILESLDHLGFTLHGLHYVIEGEFNMITSLQEKREGLEDWMGKVKLSKSGLRNFD